MAKIDKSQFTKDEWKKVRALRRHEKANTKTQKSVISSQISPQESVTSDDKKYIVCLKHGTKYPSEYVNVLYNMVKRNCSYEFEFVCFTEDERNINPEITIKPLPSLDRNVAGWWYKPMFFNPNLGLKGTILFFDLDVIVFKNIDKLFDYQPGKFCIIKDFNRSLRSNWEKFNSSVFRLQVGDQSQVYEQFLIDTYNHIRRFHGDQDWIYHVVKTNFAYWPDEWIQSYKWEMRNRAKIIRDQKGKRNFAEPGKPNIKQETSVAVFHGEPNPKDCIDQWCKDNWK